MSLGIQKGKGCAHCGKKIDHHTAVYVFRNWRRKKDPDGISEQAVVALCSYTCFLEYPWNEMKNYEDWWKAHLGKEYGNPAYTRTEVIE